MINKKQIKKVLEKQGYRIIGNNSAVKICNWTKNSLTDNGVCYKEQFYGIKSHLCAQISCTLFNCQNKCIHCWRNLDYTENINLKHLDNPKEIIENCILAQGKLLSGFKGNKKINMKKFEESKEPMQFAISLTGEPTLYPKLGELIKELRKQGKTSFVVTNGLGPAGLSKLIKEGNLPTQIYLSLNCYDKKSYDLWHKSSVKNAWNVFNKTLELFSKLNTRTVIRMTLVKDINMKSEQVEKYVKLIKKAKPDFIEVKGFISVGFARKRMGYDMMPNHEEIRDYSERIAICLGKPYKILDEHKASKVVLIGKDKKKMKIKKI